MDFVQAARQIAYPVYRKVHLKHVRGEVYANNHVKPIVECMRSNEEKVVAFLHDVPEEIVSAENKQRKKAGRDLTAKEEEYLKNS